MDKKKREPTATPVSVLVLGGNFAGVSAALEIKRKMKGSATVSPHFS